MTREAEDAREEMVKALRRAEMPEAVAEKVMALHDLAVASAAQHGYDRAHRLAIACACNGLVGGEG